MVQQVASSLAGGVTGDVEASLVRYLPLAETGSALVLTAAFVLWVRIVRTVSAAHARWAATQVPTLR